ncbi:MAG: tellurite resistance TerB family protein [Thiotrichaceae bacterium]|nr:tellurite resistance TerB family protein [Thiotrichaceae bacterium]
MDMQGFLDQLLQAGKDYAEKGQSYAEDKLNIPAEGEQRDASLDGMKKGALAIGALALLLGTGTGRKVTGTALKVGGLAAVGGIAWKVWQNYSQNQVVDKTSSPTTDSSGIEALSIDKLEGDAANERSETLVKAMLAAAKADGKIDDDETQEIKAQIQRLGLDHSIEGLIRSGVVTPLSAKSVAKLAANMNIAIEIYLVSVLMTSEENVQEQRYMANLAEALELPADVVAELEAYRKK